MTETEDEFKDVGKYFGESAHVTIPHTEDGPDYTVEGWVIWMSGAGPVHVTDDGGLALLYDHDGRCAYRLGGIERITNVSVASVQDHWVYVALAKTGSDVALWLNDGIIDRWEDAPIEAPLSASTVMKDAVGFAADFAWYDRRLPDDRLLAHWEAGKSRV